MANELGGLLQWKRIMRYAHQHICVSRHIFQIIDLIRNVTASIMWPFLIALQNNVMLHRNNDISKLSQPQVQLLWASSIYWYIHIHHIYILRIKHYIFCSFNYTSLICLFASASRSMLSAMSALCVNSPAERVQCYLSQCCIQLYLIVLMNAEI